MIIIVHTVPAESKLNNLTGVSTPFYGDDDDNNSDDKCFR